MENDYIERQAMLDAVDKLKIIPSLDGTGKPTPTEDFRVQFLGTVLKVTSADVVPVVHGRWEHHMSFGICGKCGYEYNWTGTDAKNFCPNCGAKMD